MKRNEIFHPHFSSADLVRIFNILGEEKFIFEKNLEKQRNLLLLLDLGGIHLKMYMKMKSLSLR
jgi:hypothetical protein